MVSPLFSSCLLFLCFVAGASQSQPLVRGSQSEKAGKPQQTPSTEGCASDTEKAKPKANGIVRERLHRAFSNFSQEDVCPLPLCFRK